MEVVLNGVYNFLSFIEANWTMMLAIAMLIVSIVKKTMNFLAKSNEEKVLIAKAQISEAMLRLVTEAETDYREWISAGAVKRSQVIDQIFADYPILSKVTNQQEIIAWMDDTIDEALETMREIFEKNAQNAELAM